MWRLCVSSPPPGAGSRASIGSGEEDQRPQQHEYKSDGEQWPGWQPSEQIQSLPGHTANIERPQGFRRDRATQAATQGQRYGVIQTTCIPGLDMACHRRRQDPDRRTGQRGDKERAQHGLLHAVGWSQPLYRHLIAHRPLAASSTRRESARPGRTERGRQSRRTR